MTESWQPERSAPISHLRRLRVLRGLSRAALSRKSGVGARTIAYLEAGERQPQLRTARALAAGLGVDISAAFDEFPIDYDGEQAPILLKLPLTTAQACRRLADPSLPSSLRLELCAEVAPELDRLITQAEECAWPL